MVFWHIYYKIIEIHNEWMRYPIITEQHLKKITSSTVFTRPDDNNYYRDFIFLFLNMFDYIKEYNNPIQEINRIKIKQIEIINNTKYIEDKLPYTRKINDALELVKSNIFMQEIINKTDKATIGVPDLYSLNQYVAGHCWLNARLSNNLPINDYDIQIQKSINNIVDKVEPLDYPVTLFHGFENYTYYGNKDYMVGDIINIPGFLSKSLSFNVSYNFAICENYFRPKLLVVKYPKGSKHIHYDARIFNTEFEFLTKSNEKLIVKEIIWFYLFPRKVTFYICEPL